MDNGVGVVDEASLNRQGDSESKIESEVPSDLPASNEPEGDDVFVEAVDVNSDDGADVLKEDSSNDAVASVSSDVQKAEGIVGDEQQEDEMMQDAMAVSDGFVSDESEDILLEGNDANGISVATVNDKGGTDTDGIQVDDQGVGNEENVEAEHPSIEERETGASELEGRDRVDEGPIQVDEGPIQVDEEPIQADEEPIEVPTPEVKLEKEDNEEKVGTETDAHQLRTPDEPVAGENIDEMNKELLSESSAGIVVDQNDTHEVSEDVSTGEERDNSCSLNPKDVTQASDARLQNGTTAVDVLDKPEQQSSPNGGIEHIPTISQKNEGEKKLDNGGNILVERGIPASELETSKSSDDSSSSNNKECKTIASNSEKQHDSNDQAKLSSEKRSTQGSKATETKPAAAGDSAPANSANPVLPAVRPAGLGHAAPLLEPTPRVAQQPRSNRAVSQVQPQLVEEVGNGEVEEGDETREKLQMIRVKFLRLAHRLGQTPHNVVVAQVLYRLGLAEQLRGRTGGRTGAFSYDRASAMAEQLEQTDREPLDFACTIMVLGKTGVGKSATINSIFDEVKFNTDAFDLGTKKVQAVEGTVQGIKVRVIDTPGLLPSWTEQRKNEKILNSVKQFMKKSPPDIVLYLDRLDMPSRDFSDMPLLRTVTDIFGPSIWFNAIVVLTHAASAPPEGPNGTASTYDMFVTQRSHAVQQAIRQAAGDMRLMNPVSLVENHSACRTNRAGQRVLPNGQVWKPHLLLLSFASKILAEANTLLKLQDSPPGKPFTARSRAPPLPFLLSSLLQSRPQLKMPDEQFGEDDGIDDDLDDSSDSDEESEYDELPPFRRLTNAQLAKLDKEQRKAYNDELEYREKLFMKKQLKEEKKRRKMMKKMAETAKDMPNDSGENAEEESNSAASVPVPMPDLALPASFDADNPTHRYRQLDTSNQWLVRPVLDAHGWDHDVGYEGINVERMFVVKEKVPFSFSGQVSKDKKESSLQMEVASSVKHGEGKGTTVGLDMQSVGKDLAYTLRSETLFSNYKRNKATAGLSFTLLGDAMTTGLKVEDKLIVNKKFRMVMSGGAMTGQGDIAYGGSLEATLSDKENPLSRSLTSLGLSIMNWHGDLAIGGNIQSQIPIGRFSNLIARANLNNRGTGQVSIRLNSSEQIQLALIGLIPLMKKMMNHYATTQQ